MVEVMKIMATCFKRFNACSVTLAAPNPAVGHHRLTSLLETSGHSQASRCQSLLGLLLLSLGSLGTQGFICALQESVSPVLCKFWQVYGGVNGNLPWNGLCHNQVCCTQRPCRCGRPLLTCTSAGDTQTQFWVSLCGVSGSWCTQDLFEPSEYLWWVWGLILSEISLHLPSCWGLSFACGCRVFFWGGGDGI